MPAKRPVQSLHLLRPIPRSTAIAGNPAPTFDRVPTLKCRLMWERARPRRGRCSHHLFRPMPRSTAIAGKPAPTFDRVPTLECRLMWERACPRRGQCNHHLFRPMPRSTGIAGKPAPTFECVRKSKCGSGLAREEAGAVTAPTPANATPAHPTSLAPQSASRPSPSPTQSNYTLHPVATLRSTGWHATPPTPGNAGTPG